MPLDPQARAFLDMMRNVPQPPEISLQDFRGALAALVPTDAPEPVARVEELTIPGGDRQPLGLRIYAPTGTRPLPVVVWLHGGSFTRGTVDTFDAARRMFANLCSCVVVAVEQRLSPEATFPAPLEDGYAAAVWAAEHAADFGGDPRRLGVGGESSGGNLAAALTLVARERRAPKLAFQILVAPLLDASCSSPSASAFAEGYVLTRAQLAWSYRQYAPGVRSDHPLLSPLYEPDLHGLPRAVVITMEFDPVRDEGERYADRLAAAGVPVGRARVDGMVHHYPGERGAMAVVELTRSLLAALEPAGF